MKTYKHLYQKLCSRENILLAYNKAKKGKSKRSDVIEFSKDLNNNLELLRIELLLHSYSPLPLKRMIVRDPKVRVIMKSDFKDRIVHHAVCNIIEPIFDKTFIYDSFANRKGKGTLNAVKRFESFQYKVSKNNTRHYYVFKADIRHYFEEVNHQVLLNILSKKIADKQFLFLINKILKNHSQDVGMPLGNLTSQFSANLYLNELDQYVKHSLKAKHYIRYVDDFVILHRNKEVLKDYKNKISNFLKNKLKIELHPNKSKILSIKKGIPFLGFRIFEHHKLLRKSNVWNVKRKVKNLEYSKLSEFIEGWMPYAKQADTFNLRNEISESIENRFNGFISDNRIDVLSKEVCA